MNYFDLSRLNLNLLLALQALLSEKNVTLAGEKLGLTQSAMSHYLKQLRLHYKDKLLVKGQKNSLVLTPLAESLLAPLQKACQEIHHVFNQQNEFIPETAEIKFNIGMPDYISIVFLPALLKQVRALAPKMTILVHPVKHIASLAEFEDLNLDFAIGMFKDPPPGLVKKQLFSDVAVCISCANNKHIKNELSPEEYIKHPQVLIGYKPDEESIYINRWTEKMSSKLDIAEIVPYAFAALHQIPNSPFISIVPESLAKQYCKMLNLKIHALPFPMKPYRANQYWHEKNARSSKHLWLKGMISKVAEKWGEKK